MARVLDDLHDFGDGVRPDRVSAKGFDQEDGAKSMSVEQIKLEAEAEIAAATAPELTRLVSNVSAETVTVSATSIVVLSMYASTSLSSRIGPAGGWVGNDRATGLTASDSHLR